MQKQNDTYVLEIPSGEREHEAITLGETYRVAVLDAPATTGRSTQLAERADETQHDRHEGLPSRRSRRARFER